MKSLTNHAEIQTIKEMEKESLLFNIIKDDLNNFKPSTFVTFGETMVRDTPADMERPERTRKVYLSMAGSEYTLAIGLSRLGIPAEYITRVPANPYGQAVCNIARENGVTTKNFVWAPETEPIGRLIYEIGRTPRKNTGVYQRMYSAASKLDSGMVDWKVALQHARLFHTSGITKGVLVGDAATRIKQTLMFDLPIVDKEEVQALMKADALGGGKRTSR